MPIYEIRHICSLTADQEDRLAQAITKIHTTRFNTATILVNVRFYDVSTQHSVFIGGRRRRGNHIRGVIRAGPSRTREDHLDVIADIVKAWDIIVPPVGKGKEDEWKLWSCVLMGGLVAGYEGGFFVPKAGEDVAWINEKWEEFGKRAEEGDLGFVDLMEDAKARGLVETK